MNECLSLTQIINSYSLHNQEWQHLGVSQSEIIIIRMSSGPNIIIQTIKDWCPPGMKPSSVLTQVITESNLVGGATGNNYSLSIHRQQNNKRKK